MLYGILSAISFAVMSFLVHVAGPRIPTEQLAFMRAVFGAMVLAPWMLPQAHRVLSKKAWILWLRCIAGALSLLTYFWVLRHAQVGTARALSDLSAPLLTFISFVFLKEKVTRPELIGVVSILVGALLLHRGELSELDARVTWIGLASAGFAAIAYLSLKKATQQFSGTLVVWAFSVAACVAAALASWPALGGSGQAWVMPENSFEAGVLLGVGVSGLLGQIFLTQSYARLPVAIASALGITTLVWAVLLELMFHDHATSHLVWSGYLMIVIGLAVMRIKKLRSASK